MKLTFMNFGSEKGKHKTFEEPVSYQVLCQKLDSEHRGEEVMGKWFLTEIEGEGELVVACLPGALGRSVFDIQKELDFTASVFEEWENETLLIILVHAANLLSQSFDDFIWSGWRCLIAREDKAGIRDEIQELDPAWTVPIEYPNFDAKAQTFARLHPKQVLFVDDCYLFLA